MSPWILPLLAPAKASAQQGALVFITLYRGPTRYSDQAAPHAPAAGIGGDTHNHALQQQDADSCVQATGALGGTAVAPEMALAAPANILRLFDRCETSLGPVDVLVTKHTICELETYDPAFSHIPTKRLQLPDNLSSAITDRHIVKCHILFLSFSQLWI
jgi:NAD(P)-dependent dehydrogenase (short-subunit alcohol dehydrogenase family)